MAGELSPEATRTGGRAATTAIIKGRFALSVGNPATSLPNGWAWTPLSSIARLETGHTPSRQHPEWWGGDIPWIGIRDATSNHGRTIFETREYTNELGIQNSSARVLPENTVCLSRTASVGYVVVMGRPMCTSQDFVNWVCSEEIDYRFLKYVLLAEKDAILQYASGTTHQTIYFPEVKAFHVSLPPRSEQSQIAEILSALDDKIELNRKIADTLEEMARALFRSWFVDFDPVRAKAERRVTGLEKNISALFPSRFGDDGLPKGWSKVSLTHVARFLNGLALQKFPARPGEDGLPVIKIPELRTGTSSKSDRAASNIPDQYIIKTGDQVFSWSGSLTQTIWTHGPGALNQHLFKVTPVAAPKWYCYLAVDQHLPEFQAIAADKAVTMGHIQRYHLDRALVALPPQNFFRAVEGLFSSLFDRWIAARVEAQTHAALRDTLLPKLISGEMRVKDADQAVEAA